MAMGLGWTVLLNGMLGLAGYAWARDGFRQPPGLPRILAAVVLGWAWATLGMELLGAAGVLGRASLLAWTALAAGAGTWLHRRRPADPGPAPETAPEGP